MSHQIRATYEQSFLFPPSLEDWVPPDHPARFIREFVDALDLDGVGMASETGESTDGRPAYAPDLLLKVWLYGYYWRIRSSRRLEAACREHVGLLWLTGLHNPDHNTLWRFFRRNKSGMRLLFKQSVRVALQAELVGLVLHAVDGTKIAADVSPRSAWHKPMLEDLLGKLDEQLSQFERDVEIEAPEQAPEGYRLPASMQETHRLRETVCAALETLGACERKHFHPVDSDARMMAFAGMGRKAFAYNAQAVVDEAHGLIVAQDVVNDENDYNQLMPMLDEVKGVLETTAQTTVADCGYSAGTALLEAEARGHDVVVNMRSNVAADDEKPYHSSRFSYDRERDCCICPRGEILAYQKDRCSRRKNHTVRVYRCRNNECPVRSACTQEKGGRAIEIAPYHKAVMNQRTKHLDPKYLAALAKRGRIVEPVFGILKSNHGFRRWTVRGLDGVKAQWALLCTTYNLQKLYQGWCSSRLALAG